MTNPTGPSAPSTRQEIESALEDAVTATRSWSREQASYWRQIPEAALEADGITGYSDRHSYAWSYGFWQLHSSSQGGHYRVYVDLSNGELVSSSSAGDYASGAIGAPILCAGNDVLALSLSELDAKQTLEDLIAYAARPPFEGYDIEAVARWREEKRLTLPDVWTPRLVATSYEEAKLIAEAKATVAPVGPLSRPSSLSEA